MRILLLLLLVLAPTDASGAAAEFVDRLRAMGPQRLQVSEDLGPPTGRARLEVEADGALRLTWGEGLARTFRHHPGETPKDPWKEPERGHEPFAYHCRSVGTAERMTVSCWIPSDLRAANLRPPSVVYEFEIRDDGVRVVRTSGRSEERMVFSPAGLSPPRPPGVGPGAPAVLADALAQLAAHEKGGLGGGSSGGGDWYASDLWIREVRGLDFVVERTVWPDRGGRSNLVPARWSFDYQGSASGEPQAVAWLMVKDGREEFWCVGQARRTAVAIVCRQGRKAWTPGPEAKADFVLAPYPKWTIRIEEGPHSLFSSVGTSRLEPLSYP